MAYRQPGDVDVQELMLINYNGSDSADLKRITGEINLYEDLMSNALYGNLVVYDAIDMIQALPIIGEETLRLSFSVPGEETKISKLFRVYKISDRKRDSNDTAVSYILHFTSKEYFEVLNKSVQKSYTGKRISDVVQLVYDSFVWDEKRPKDISIEENRTP